MTDKEPSALEMMVHQLSKTGTSQIKAVAKTISFRIPLADLALVDAFSQHIDSSRQKAIAYTLRAGLEEVLSKLDENTARVIQTRQMEILGDLIKAAGISEGELFDSEAK